MARGLKHRWLRLDQEFQGYNPAWAGGSREFPDPGARKLEPTLLEVLRPQPLGIPTPGPGDPGLAHPQGCHPKAGSSHQFPLGALSHCPGHLLAPGWTLSLWLLGPEPEGLLSSVNLLADSRHSFAGRPRLGSALPDSADVSESGLGQ